MTHGDARDEAAGESLLVWVEAWQMQCCGDPIEVGSSVEWTLYEAPGGDWLASLLGESLASQVTHGEEHHGGLPEGTQATAGSVARIRAASSRFQPDPATPTENIYVPLPGTAVVVDVPAADGWFPETDGLRFNGYLVHLRPMKG
jgi:hypothetical protein